MNRTLKNTHVRKAIAGAVMTAAVTLGPLAGSASANTPKGNGLVTPVVLDVSCSDGSSGLLTVRGDGAGVWLTDGTHVIGTSITFSYTSDNPDDPSGSFTKTYGQRNSGGQVVSCVGDGTETRDGFTYTRHAQFSGVTTPPKA